MAMQLGGGSMRSEMNITPYIDVLLVLLITFMLMSQRLVISANLAREGGSPTDGTHAIVLELANDGRFLINTQEVPREQLGAKLREIMAPRRDRMLFVKSGTQRTWGETVEAMDVAKGAGVEVIALAP